jgi:dienelactone hydrolase
MKPLRAVAVLLFCPLFVMGGIKSEAIEYKVGEKVFEGQFYYDDADVTPRRAILVCHEWWGLNDYAKHRAEQLAQMGYVAFAADMYGKGVTAKTAQEAAKMATALKDDRAALRARVNAALAALKSRKEVDPKKVGAIGYCFGGTTALELARSGADVAGVVSFHGALATPTPADAKNIKGKVLACHGADDPHVPPAEVAAFLDEMKKGGVNYQFNTYGAAVHTFTNPAAGNDPSKGSAYNEQADKRSWQEMQMFFAEVFR